MSVLITALLLALPAPLRAQDGSAEDSTQSVPSWDPPASLGSAPPVEPDSQAFSDETWRLFTAEACRMQARMPQDVSVNRSQRKAENGMVIRLTTYQSIDDSEGNSYSEGTSYSILCYAFSSDYPFDQFADRLTHLFSRSMMNTSDARMVAVRDTTLSGLPVRQTVTHDGLYYYGRTFRVNRQIISLSVSSPTEASFEAPPVRTFFDSVQISEQ